MRLKRIIALSAVAVAATSMLAATAPATANEVTNPTFNVAPAGFPSSAGAYGAKLGGLLTLHETASANCNSDHVADIHAAVAVNTGGLANVNALTGQCAIDFETSETDAQGTVANASLLNHLIDVTAVDSRCQVTPTPEGNVAIWGSTIGSLVVRTNYSKQGSGKIVIPGIANIFVNQKFHVGGSFSTIALQVDVLPHGLVAAQRIILGFCQINTYNPE